jgi:hypothetical protein
MLEYQRSWGKQDKETARFGGYLNWKAQDVVIKSDVLGQ